MTQLALYTGVDAHGTPRKKTYPVNDDSQPTPTYIAPEGHVMRLTAVLSDCLGDDTLVGECKRVAREARARHERIARDVASLSSELD